MQCTFAVCCLCYPPSEEGREQQLSVLTWPRVRPTTIALTLMASLSIQQKDGMYFVLNYRALTIQTSTHPIRYATKIHLTNPSVISQIPEMSCLPLWISKRYLCALSCISLSLCRLNAVNLSCNAHPNSHTTHFDSVDGLYP
jgi:hypothetical protein